MRVLIAGCGYVGRALGLRLAFDGHQVAGLRRSRGDLAALRAAGIEPFAADLTRPATLAALGEVPWDWVVQCAAPAEGTEAAYRSVYVDGAHNLIRALHSRPPKGFVFVGSTSVYGQTDGSAVDEGAPTEPVDFAGRVLVEAEAVVQEAAALGWSATVLRVAGIYGPGRNRLAPARRGEARLVGDGSRWMNLIHRDDLVSAIVAVLACAPASTARVYNVCDGAPPTEAEFYSWLAGRLGVLMARTDASGRPGRRSRRATNKRVVAERLRRETGWQPAFPDYRAGYESLLAAESEREPGPAPPSAGNG